MKTNPKLLRLLGAVAVVITACGGTSSAQSSPTTATSESQVEPVTTLEQPAPATTATTSAAVLDEQRSPEAILDDAITSLGDSYEFSSEVLVDGVVVSLGQGRNISDATEVQLDQEDTTLVYRSIGTQRWVQVPGESWVQLADSSIPTSPLAGLDTPKTLELIADTNGTTTLQASYDPTILSLTTPDDLTVTLTIVDGILSKLDYSGDASNSVIDLHTTFTRTTGLEPILAP